MVIITTGTARIYSLPAEVVITMSTWAKVGKTKDIRELDTRKRVRPDLNERGGAS